MFSFDVPDLTPVQVLKAVACLAYQSCETPDWTTTVACNILNEIKEFAIRKLPGYEGAAWTIE